MSDTPTPPNNGADAAPKTADAQPRFVVLAQYLKDFSFENPRAPAVFKGTESPQMDVNVDVNARTIGEDQYEVELSVSAKAMHGGECSFMVEGVYAGAFEIKNVPREQLEAVMLVECPRLLFPFLRQIIAEATRNGNFPPLMLEPIDFMGIFIANKQRQQQQAAGQNTAAPAPTSQNA